MENKEFTTYEVHEMVNGKVSEGYISPDARFYEDGEYTEVSAFDHKIALEEKHPGSEYVVVIHHQKHEYEIAKLIEIRAE